MQPATDKEYQYPSTVLKETSTCLFDLSLHVYWLQHIAFSYRYYTDFKRKYHSFVGTPPEFDGSSEKIAHISGASIYGGFLAVNMRKNY